jgi:hypothetical protein
MGIHSASSAEVFSSFVSIPLCRQRLFLFFSVSPSSQVFLGLLSAFSGIRLLL